MSKSRKKAPIKLYSNESVALGKSTQVYNNKYPLPKIKAPEYIYGLFGEILPLYYIRNKTVKLIHSGSFEELGLALKQDKMLALPLHPFIDKLIDKYDFCIDCYAELMSQYNQPLVIEDNYNSFNKYFNKLDALDPYTMLPINKFKSANTVSIEHIVPYSKTSINIFLDADFQNLCYVDKSVNSMRKDHQLSFNNKQPDKTLSVYYDGKAHKYNEFIKDKPHETIDDYPTTERHNNTTFFLPPTKSFGFLSRRILYCILTYLDTNCDQFEDIYSDFDFDILLKVISNDYNLGYNRFEFIYDDNIKKLQQSENFCLTNGYIIVKKLFSKSTHIH